MSNQAPVNVIMSPFEVYVAPVGTAFPTMGGVLDPAWKKFGTAGSLDYGDSGVKVSYDQKFTEYTGNAGAVRKVVRNSESLTVSFEIADVSLEALAAAMNNATVTATATEKSMKIGQGSDVNYVSLLIIGQSPYSSDVADMLQFEIPKAYQSGKVEPSFSKKGPAMTGYTFSSVAGPNATATDPDLGTIRAGLPA